MLTVRLYFADGTRADAEISPRRAFPKLVSFGYADVNMKLFVRRGESVGTDSDCYDETEPVQAVRAGSPPDTDLFTDPPEGTP